MPQPYNDETLLPDVPFYVLERRLLKLQTFLYAYRQHYFQCLEDGFTFVDWTSDELGSTAAIVENSLEGKDESPLLQAWSRAGWVDNGWLTIPTDDPEQGDMTFHGAIQEVFALTSPGPVEHTALAWNTAVFAPVALGKASVRAWAGIASRMSIRYVQLKVAMQLRNIFRLDDRGRPEGS